MFKRELKVNLKSFILWSVLIVGLYMMVYAIYPSITNGEQVELINEMLKVFPNEILMAFNMDISTLDHAYGWLKSEGFVFILLIIGCYSGMLGSSIVLKEENDKTIEYLHSLPVKRVNIVLSKVFASLFYIVLMVIIVTLFNYVGLKYSGEFDVKQFFVLSMTPLLSSLPLFSICLFISTFMHKTKTMSATALGLTFAMYIIQVISTLSKDVEFLKYISVYTLADIRTVILESSINHYMIIISLLITVIGIVATLIRYNFKEMI